MNLFMAQSNNPVPKLLKLIPEQKAILSLLLADEMREVIQKAINKRVNNSYIIVLLAHLAEAGLINILEISAPDVAGAIILIQRNPDGNV